jgi:hypothetical protein
MGTSWAAAASTTPRRTTNSAASGLTFLANVLAIGVVTFVEDAGKVPEIPTTEVLEQADLPQNFHEARAALWHGPFRW